MPFLHLIQVNKLFRIVFRKIHYFKYLRTIIEKNPATDQILNTRINVTCTIQLRIVHFLNMKEIFLNRNRLQIKNLCRLSLEMQIDFEVED